MVCVLCGVVRQQRATSKMLKKKKHQHRQQLRDVRAKIMPMIVESKENLETTNFFSILLH